jgi:hypothetical protein
MYCEGKLKLRSHNTSNCLIEGVTKAGLTIYYDMSARELLVLDGDFEELTILRSSSRIDCSVCSGNSSPPIDTISVSSLFFGVIEWGLWDLECDDLLLKFFISMLCCGSCLSFPIWLDFRPDRFELFVAPISFSVVDLRCSCGPPFFCSSLVLRIIGFGLSVVKEGPLYAKLAIGLFPGLFLWGSLPRDVCCKY